jgi:hypothetical protein
MKPSGNPALKSADQLQEVIAFLRRDTLKNIVLLKMLFAYSEASRCYYLQQAGTAGILLLLPVRVSAFDRQLYPTMDYVIFLTATGADIVRALLACVPVNCNLVFKLTDSYVQAMVAERFKLRWVTAYISYTTPPGYQATPVEDGVVVSDQVDEGCYELYAAQGYGRDEVAHYFAGGQARSLTRYQGDRPIAGCFTYQNYGEVHEIASVYTVPAERRKGHGRAVVSSALNNLISRQLVPRYQVREDNYPSLRLAEAMGLKQFATIEHWLYEPALSRQKKVPPSGVDTNL